MSSARSSLARISFDEIEKTKGKLSRPKNKEKEKKETDSWREKETEIYSREFPTKLSLSLFLSDSVSGNDFRVWNAI